MKGGTTRNQKKNGINKPFMPFTDNSGNWAFHFSSPGVRCLSYFGHFVSSERESKNDRKKRVRRPLVLLLPLLLSLPKIRNDGKSIERKEKSLIFVRFPFSFLVHDTKMKMITIMTIRTIFWAFSLENHPIQCACSSRLVVGSLTTHFFPWQSIITTFTHIQDAK